MFIIDCPWCGARDQSEFVAKGEAHIARPDDPKMLNDQAWGDYVFFRDNTKGVGYERWVHASGCNRWFNVMRNTVTEEIYASYKPGDERPALPEASQ